MNSQRFFLTCAIILLWHISLHATVTLTASVVDNTCYNGTAGSITGSAAGGNSGLFEYRLATGPASGWQTSATFTLLAAGTYPLSARDRNNVNDIATAFVTVGQPTVIAIAYTATNTSCSASTDGMISLTASGGKAPYSYTWTKNGTFINGAITPSITGLTPAIYNAIVTDANGCQQLLTSASTTAIIPLSLTGFNQDVIANGTNTATSSNNTVTSGMDGTGPGYNLYAINYKSSSSAAAFTTGGFPTNRSITSTVNNAHQFVLADYSASNDLYLDGAGTTGTLTLAGANVAPYQNLYLLATSGNGTSSVNYSVKYADNTTSTGSLSITDWAGSTANIAIGSLERIYYNGPSGLKDGNGPIFAVYDLPISLSANTKNVTSITFTSLSYPQANIFAITGSTSAVGVAVAAGGASSVTPSVAISSNPTNQTYCSGQNFTFVATPTNAGSSPSYVWSVGGTTQASTSFTMSTTVSGTGTKNVVATLSVTDATATCLTSQTATKTIALTAGSIATSTNITGPGSVCQGMGTTYMATPVNGGISPTYAWYVNGSVVSGATSPTYTATLGTGANSIYSVLTSSISCATSNPATSNTVSTNVNPTLTPSVTIDGTLTTTGSNTDVAFFITSSAYLGGAPAYQWYLNGNTVPSATSSTYSATNVASSDQYSLAISSTATCARPIQSMSNYVVISTLLPISLNWLKAELKNNNNALLSWQTTLEKNVKNFEVQMSRSLTGSFATIGAVKASNSSSGSSYCYTDTLKVNGNYFYRLKTVDLDGAFTYSPIVPVIFNKGTSTSMMVYPNPFSSELHLQISSSQGIRNAGFTIYNLAGQSLYTTVKSINPGTQTINLTSLNKIPSGVYILQLNGADIDNNQVKIIKN